MTVTKHSLTSTRGKLASRVKSLRSVLATIACACVMACADSAPTTSNAVAVVELSAPTPSVRAGSTLTMSVKLKDASGNSIDNVAVTWSSSNSTFATVSSTGVVTANAAGKVTIAASALGKSATKEITIQDREIAAVEITPASVSVRIGTTVSLTAKAVDAEGRTLTGRQIAWSSSNTAIATVNSEGVVTGVAAGAATITAQSENRSGTAAVTVTVNPVATVTIVPGSDTLGVGTDAQLVATLRDAGGQVLIGRAIAWNSSNVQVATVSSTGVVTALSPGTVVVSAVSEGRVGTASVLVLARLASAVTLTPSNATIITGTTLQLTSQITDPSGNILTGRPISYVSDNSAVATVSNAGLITAIRPGTAKITATSEGKVGTANVVVNPLPVATVQITPATATVLTGTTRQLQWQALSATGTALTGRTIAWTSGAPTVASVSATGLVTPIAPGTAIIAGVVEGVAGFATITVQLPVVASVSVTPTAPSISVGQMVLLTATPRDGSGNPLTGRAITWSSSDDRIAFVTSSGAVIGIAVGNATIIATSEGGVRGQIVINVR